MILLSIIIPTKNRTGFLKNSLNNLNDKNSSLNYELIVVDDGSSEENSINNENICGLVSNCRYFRNVTSLGAPRSRNFGFSVSKGQYIWFLDDDDLVTIATLEKVISYLRSLLKNNSVKMFLLPFQIKSSKEFSEIVLPRKEENNFDYYRKRGSHINTSCAIFHRDIISDVHGWDEKLKTGQDTDLFLRVSRVYQINIIDSDPVTIFQEHSDRLGKKVFKQQIGKIQFLKKHWKILSFKRRFYYISTLLLWIPFFRKFRMYNEIKRIVMKNK